MVVLTLLLAKAAYDHYNKNNSRISDDDYDDEIVLLNKNNNNNNDDDNNTRNTNIDSNNHNNHNNHNSYPTQSLNNRTNSRPITRKPSFSNGTKHSTNNRAIKSSNSKQLRQLRPRSHPSPVVVSTLQSSHCTGSSFHSNTRYYNSRYNNISNSKSNGSYNNINGNSNTMADCSTVSTSHGDYFVLDEKNRILGLLPEAEPYPIKKNIDGQTTTTTTTTTTEEDDDDTIKTDYVQSNTTTNATENNTNQSTFRSDVRNEWVDAVFGKDFFPMDPPCNVTNRTEDLGIKQGVGQSGISHYVTYGALLDPAKYSREHSSYPNNNPSSSINNNNNNNNNGNGDNFNNGNFGGSIHSNNSRNNDDSSTGQKRNTTNGNRMQISSARKMTQSTPIVMSPSLLPSSLSLVASTSREGFHTPTAGNATANEYGNLAGNGNCATNNNSNNNNNNNSSTTHTNNNNPNPPKVGATISRIPLGLYVRSISIDSEAYTAGILPGSILVDVNGMGMLGETSHRALERLWRYDGTFFGGNNAGGIGKEEGFRDGSNSSNGTTYANGGDYNRRDLEGDNHNNASTANANNDVSGKSSDIRMKKPVLLRFYRRGHIYATLLLSGKPLSGIEWAPCGNFALVQRSYGLAAEAGVRRGCLVVGVEEEGLRTLDHVGVAWKLKEKFGRGEKITIRLGYTPAASRSGFHERNVDEKHTANPNVVRGSSAETFRNNSRSHGDVEIRSRPVEYSAAVVDTFFACTGPSAMSAVMDTTSGSQAMGAPSSKSSSTAVGSAGAIADVAAFVAAGGILPPRGVAVAASKIAAIRSDNSSQRRGNGSQRLVGSSEGGSSNQNIAAVAAGSKCFAPCPQIEPHQLLDEWNPLVSLARSMSYQAAGCCETTYVEMGGPFRVWEQTGEVPLSSSMDYDVSIIQSIATTLPAGIAEGVFDAHILQLLGVAISPICAPLAEQLFDILIDVALNDNDLCQRLFFLLRSFIGVLEEQKIPPGSDATDDAVSAMKLLRYAQRRLSGRLFDKSASTEQDRQCSEGYPVSRESSSSTRMTPNYSQLTISASESTIDNFHSRTPAMESNRESNYPSQEPMSASLTNKLEDAKALEITDTTLDDNQSDSQSPNSYDPSHENSNRATNVMEDAAVKKKSKSKKVLQLLRAGKSKLSLKKIPTDNQTTLPSGKPLPQPKKSPKSRPSKILNPEKAFSFTNVLRKSSQEISALETIDGVPRGNPQTMTTYFENMSWILRQIDNTCAAINKNLIKSFPQKMADWALYPWSASKENALASITQSFRNELCVLNSIGCSLSETRFPVLNPVDSSELLTSVDADECFILPSAHFPLLLCFNSKPQPTPSLAKAKDLHSMAHGCCRDTVYRTKVELLGLRSSSSSTMQGNGEAHIVQGVVAGVMQESGASVRCLDPHSPNLDDTTFYRWTAGNTLLFESRSNWGCPKTLSLKISTAEDATFTDEKGAPPIISEMGCGFVDLCSIWNGPDEESDVRTVITKSAEIHSFENAVEFDQHGEVDDSLASGEVLELRLRITGEIVSAAEQPQKRLLLYKHGDDLRQELLAIQFIEKCSQILQASGLDLKLKTFRCLPVGAQKGFIEWVSGTVPLSELCQSTGSSCPGSAAESRQSSWSKDGYTDLNETVDSSPTPIEVMNQADGIQSQRRGWCKHQSLRGLRQNTGTTSIENPIQDFLRSAGYDKFAPYFVRKDVMDAYVKSCAGYCVITYLLGVGDRHLDNILLHQNGHLLHCDYSFILGNDPKTYLPMRITEEMIKGFGGRESDNFAKFLSCTGAAFLTLRRHNNLHSLLSLIRNMVCTNMRDISMIQPPEEAIFAMRGRFRLDLNDDDALAYIEHVVEKSIASKMWRALDAMHTLGKHF